VQAPSRSCRNHFWCENSRDPIQGTQFNWLRVRKTFCVGCCSLQRTDIIDDKRSLIKIIKTRNERRTMKMKFVPFWSRLSGYLSAIWGSILAHSRTGCWQDNCRFPLPKELSWETHGEPAFGSFLFQPSSLSSRLTEIAKLGRSECSPLQGGNLAKTSGPKR